MTIPLFRLSDFCRIVNRGRDSGWLQRNSVFWMHEGSCICKLTVVGTECTRCVQAQTKPNPSMEEGAECTVLSLSVELLVTVGYWAVPGNLNTLQWKTDYLRIFQCTCWSWRTKKGVRTQSWEGKEGGELVEEGEYNPKISLTVSKNKEEIKKHLNVAI